MFSSFTMSINKNDLRYNILHYIIIIISMLSISITKLSTQCIDKFPKGIGRMIYKRKFIIYLIYYIIICKM